MSLTLYKIGGAYFRLFGAKGFHVKAKNERFTAASSCCGHNLKYENFTSSFGRLRQTIVPQSVPHVQHDYFSSFNQWNHWFVVTLPSSNLRLPITQARRQRQREPHKFAYLTSEWKKHFCTLCTCIFFFIFCTFCSRSCPFDGVKWPVLSFVSTTRALEDKLKTCWSYCLCPADSNLIPGYLGQNLQTWRLGIIKKWLHKREITFWDEALAVVVFA